MLKENVLKYYTELDYNCAESISRGANEYYGLGLSEEALRLLGGFGGGCCSGRLCGACAGGVAVISEKYILTRAHQEEAARDHVRDFMEAFIEVLGSDLCTELKERYWDDEGEAARCIRTVEMAADLLEQKITEYEK